MKNNHACKAFAALLAVAVLLATGAAATAQALEPRSALQPELLGGKTFDATVGAYDARTQRFAVTLYERDVYVKEAIDALQPGDTLVFDDAEHVLKSVSLSPMDTPEFVFEDGEEILMHDLEDGTYLARSAWDDRTCMHLVSVWNLRPAADMILTDTSDLEQDEPVVTAGLEAILAIQKERAIGFDFSVTKITLNENAEIAEIRVDYAPWQ